MKFFRKVDTLDSQDDQPSNFLDYAKIATRVVGGLSATYFVMHYGPDSTIDGLISMIPLGVFAGGMSRLTKKFGGKHMDVKAVSGPPSADKIVLSIRVDGIIVGEGKRDLSLAVFGFTAVSGYDVQEALHEAARDKKIEAVLLQFSTPGGTIPGAQAIYDGIRHYKESTGKPIIAHIEGMSASGGVYAMVGADEIYAEPGSLIGSIGVTLGTRHWYDNPIATTGGLSGGVETSGGIRSYVLAAGRGKDMLSPWREPDPEEISVLQDQLEILYSDFVTHVSVSRSIANNIIRDSMGAYVFENKQAEIFGLIDGTKTRSQMVAHLANKIGVVPDRISMVRQKKKPGRFLKLIGAEALYGALAVYDGPGIMSPQTGGLNV